MKITGVYTATITPFDSKGDVDEEGFRQNLCYQLEHNIDGIVVLGTTGESPTLTHEEKRHIIKIAVDELKGKCTLLVGTGSYSTAATILATQEAKDLGADGALIITPYYNRPKQEGLFQHFVEICQKVSFPFVIYNNPTRTAQGISSDTLKKLVSTYSTIVGFKDCSNHIGFISDVIEWSKENHSHFTFLSGDDISTLPIIAMGGQGVISTAANLIPTPMRTLVSAALAGNYPIAREWHYRLAPLFRLTSCETNPIPIKAMMNLCHLAAGACRLPLSQLSEENLRKFEHYTKTIPQEWIS